VSKEKDLLADYLSREELAVAFHVKPRTISEWIGKPNGLPHTKLGRSYFFQIDAVRAWLERRTSARNKNRAR
jgi:excisionase family DNA binding protein